jgi:uncharacterized Zn-binding protein involved in type VI secretion
VEYAAGLADALKSEPGVEVQVVDGARGELTVLVDGKAVARKGDSMPDIAAVLDAVRETGSVADAG